MLTSSILANQLYAEREKTGDVTFIVESECVFAHRCVLAALSPKYDAQFYGNRPNNDDVYVDDITAPAFKEFIKFLYLEEANFSLNNIAEILNMANLCFVKHLKTKCGIFLIENLHRNNLLAIFNLAILYDIKPVLDLCEHNFKSIVPSIFISDDFTECSDDVLHHILNIESLNCPVITILTGCISWAKAACRRKHVDNTNMQNLRKELDKVFSRIPFERLTLKEFVAFHKSHDGLLTPDKFIEITYKIAENTKDEQCQIKNNCEVDCNDYDDDDEIWNSLLSKSK